MQQPRTPVERGMAVGVEIVEKNKPCLLKCNVLQLLSICFGHLKLKNAAKRGVKAYTCLKVLLSIVYVVEPCVHWPYCMSQKRRCVTRSAVSNQCR